MEDISQKLENSQEKYEAAYQDERVCALQKAPSQMRAIDDSVDELGGRGSSIQSNLKQLESLILPIHRCPLEILQEIFELVVCQDERFGGRWSRSATILSQVCKRWRTVALQTPSLWTKLWVPVAAKHSAIKSFFERSTQRIKMMKPTISLVGIMGTHAELEAINLCQLDKFPHIECIEIRFQCPELVGKFITNVLHLLRLPVGPVDQLVICCNGPEKVPIPNVGPIIELFPNTSKLTLEWIPGLSLPAELVMPNVQELTLSTCLSASLASMAKSFPNLRYLLLIHVDIQRQDTSNVEWVQLRSLCLHSSRFPWSRLKAPRLKGIWFNWKQRINDDLLTFISRTPSLEHIDTNAMTANVWPILARTPNLVSLTTESYDSFTEPSQINWENLDKFQTLTLASFDTHLSTEQFDKIAQNYFLPIPDEYGANNVISGPRYRKELRVIVPTWIENKRCQWLNSKLVSSVSEILMYDKQRDIWYKCFTFKWK